MELTRMGSILNQVEILMNITLVCVFIIGILQSLPCLFKKDKRFHSLLGNIYVLFSFFFIAPSTMFIGLFQTLINLKVFFILLGILLAYSTRKSVLNLLKQNWLGHFRWMLLSYVCVIEIGLLRIFEDYPHQLKIVGVIMLLFLIINFIFQRLNIYQRYVNHYINHH
ncbi:MAG: DUF2306 domain-containing protein [Chitinophagales bacterium]|nr:DUF2306 domain-containing protein [Chitinophagales bacterium]